MLDTEQHNLKMSFESYAQHLNEIALDQHGNPSLSDVMQLLLSFNKFLEVNAELIGQLQEENSKLTSLYLNFVFLKSNFVSMLLAAHSTMPESDYSEQVQLVLETILNADADSPWNDLTPQCYGMVVDHYRQFFNGNALATDSELELKIQLLHERRHIQQVYKLLGEEHGDEFSDKENFLMGLDLLDFNHVSEITVYAQNLELLWNHFMYRFKRFDGDPVILRKLIEVTDDFEQFLIEAEAANDLDVAEIDDDYDIMIALKLVTARELFENCQQYLHALSPTPQPSIMPTAPFSEVQRQEQPLEVASKQQVIEKVDEVKEALPLVKRASVHVNSREIPQEFSPVLRSLRGLDLTTLGGILTLFTSQDSVVGEQQPLALLDPTSPDLSLSLRQLGELAKLALPGDVESASRCVSKLAKVSDQSITLGQLAEIKPELYENIQRVLFNLFLQALFFAQQNGKKHLQLSVEHPDGSVERLIFHVSTMVASIGNLGVLERAGEQLAIEAEVTPTPPLTLKREQHTRSTPQRPKKERDLGERFSEHQATFTSLNTQLAKENPDLSEIEKAFNAAREQWRAFLLEVNSIEDANGELAKTVASINGYDETVKKLGKTLSKEQAITCAYVEDSSKTLLSLYDEVKKIIDSDFPDEENAEAIFKLAEEMYSSLQINLRAKKLSTSLPKIDALRNEAAAKLNYVFNGQFSDAQLKFGMELLEWNLVRKAQGGSAAAKELKKSAKSLVAEIGAAEVQQIAVAIRALFVGVTFLKDDIEALKKVLSSEIAEAVWTNNPLSLVDMPCEIIDRLEAKQQGLRYLELKRLELLSSNPKEASADKQQKAIGVAKCVRTLKETLRPKYPEEKLKSKLQTALEFARAYKFSEFIGNAFTSFFKGLWVPKSTAYDAKANCSTAFLATTKKRQANTGRVFNTVLDQFKPVTLVK